MITRIVKMQFRPETIGLFLEYLPQYQAAIRASEGCAYLQILRQTDAPCTVFTYSHWQRAEDLENYRQSELFQKVWGQVRTWFGEKPEAWSLDTIWESKAQ